MSTDFDAPEACDCGDCSQCHDDAFAEAKLARLEKAVRAIALAILPDSELGWCREVAHAAMVGNDARLERLVQVGRTKIQRPVF